MNIYFAGSIRGGRGDAALYEQLIRLLQPYGRVMTEHLGSAVLTEGGDQGVTDRYIHDRDMEWLKAADLVVAEVTTISAGVGYEIGRAVALGKKILCLYREQPGKRLSAMIAGCPELTVFCYQRPEEVGEALDHFFSGNL